MWFFKLWFNDIGRNRVFTCLRQNVYMSGEAWALVVKYLCWYWCQNTCRSVIHLFIVCCVICMPNTSLVTKGWKVVAFLHEFIFFSRLSLVLLLLCSCSSTLMTSRAHGTELPVMWNYKEFAFVWIPGFQY
jgi:hypothetical protein